MTFGKTSAGKSTFLASLGIPGIETGIKRTTMKKRAYVFIEEIMDPKEMNSSQINHLSNVVEKHFGLAPEDVIIAANILALKNTIIIDMPGIDDAENHNDYMAMALDMAGKVDQVICMGDITSFSGNDLLAKIDELRITLDNNNKNGHYCDILYIVNKIDNQEDFQAEEGVTDILSRLGQKYGMEQGQNFFRFSAVLRKINTYMLLADQPDMHITISSRKELSEFMMHLQSVGATHLAAFKKIHGEAKRIRQAMKDGNLGAKDEDVKLRINMADFAGELPNMEGQSGDHDDLIGHLTLLAQIMPDLQYNAGIEYHGNHLVNMVNAYTSNTAANTNDLKNAIEAIPDRYKSDGKILTHVMDTVMKGQINNAYMSVIMAFMEHGFKYPKEANLFKVFREYINGGIEQSYKKWPKLDGSSPINFYIADLLAIGLGSIGKMREIMACPSFWQNSYVHMGENIPYYDLLRRAIGLLPENRHTKLALELINFGKISRADRTIMLIKGDDYIKKICQILSLDVNRYYYWIISDRGNESNALHHLGFDYPDLGNISSLAINERNLDDFLGQKNHGKK